MLPWIRQVYQPDLLHEISKHQLLREARLHANLNHPNIIKMYAAFKQAGLEHTIEPTQLYQLPPSNSLTVPYP